MEPYGTSMKQLILEFPLPLGSATVQRERLSVDLGNGVRLISAAPKWVRVVSAAKLQLIMEVDGDADSQ